MPGSEAEAADLLDAYLARAGHGGGLGAARARDWDEYWHER
jgi:hypothetical protein